MGYFLLLCLARDRHLPPAGHGKGCGHEMVTPHSAVTVTECWEEGSWVGPLMFGVTKRCSSKAAAATDAGVWLVVRDVNGVLSLWSGWAWVATYLSLDATQ